MSFLTDHLRDTDVPQTYFQHGRFAFTRSVRLIVAGLAGVIHAIFPWWFTFYTSEKIVMTYVEVKASGRHDDLLVKYGLMDEGWLTPWEGDTTPPSRMGATRNDPGC